MDQCLLALARQQDSGTAMLTAETLTELGHILLAPGRREQAVLRWKAALGHYEHAQRGCV